MTTIDTSALDNWPDPGTVRTVADDLLTACKDYHTKTTDLETEWKKLRNAGTYETPEREALVNSAGTVTDKGSHVEQAGESSKAALHLFADTVETLNTTRKTLLDDVSAFEKKPDPAADDREATQAHTREGALLVGRVTSLSAQFTAAVSDCAAALDGIDQQGNPDDKLLRQAIKLGKGPLMGLLGTAVKNWTVTQTRVYTQRVFKLAGVDFEIPFTKNQVDFKSDLLHYDWKPNDWTKADSVRQYLGEFGKRLRDRFLWEPGKPWGDPTRISNSAKNWGFDTETFEQTRTTKTGWARGGSRALGAVGTLWGMWNEGEARYAELGSEHPEMTDSERRNEAIEAGVVRGGSQALATAAVTAGVCSVVPGIGTAGGFLVGLGVGYAMSIKVDGKSVNDLVGDGAEAAWDATKEGAEKAWDGVKSGAGAAVDTVKGWFS